MISPIETIYNGFRFRSRLEARWAVFFDQIGSKYVYEPDGYVLPSGPYLPDFWLTGWKLFVEVKPAVMRPKGWKVAPEGIDPACPAVCRKSMELAHNVASTVMVFGDPYEVITEGSGIWFFAMDRFDFDFLWERWKAGEDEALFARQARFERGETPVRPRPLDVTP